MSTLASTPNIDPEPILRYIALKGGNCSFDEAMQPYIRLGMTSTQARDAQPRPAIVRWGDRIYSRPTITHT